MKSKEYDTKRNELIKSFDNFSIKDDEGLTAQFNIVSASLSNFLPGIPFTSHLEIYKNILLHKKLSIFEQQSYDVLDYLTIENDGNAISVFLKKQPCIICTFHTGSYRVINLLLTKYNIPFSLAIGKEIGESEGHLFSSIFNKLADTSSPEQFKIINAENPKAGLQMLRELKHGRTLVLYIDGNSGAGIDTVENENSCLVNFMEQQIYARKGIAFLSFVANVPILTAASYRASWDDIRLRFFDPILPSCSPDRESFAIEGTQSLYDLVSPVIKSYPEQWEGWLYIHKTAKVKDDAVSTTLIDNHLSAKDSLCFNSSQFGIFKVSSTTFLFRKRAYLFYEIDNEVYKQLIECIARPLRKEDFEERLFDQLYSHGVLMKL
jgi:lauroyl/myristoyl acyltransferase